LVLLFGQHALAQSLTAGAEVQPRLRAALASASAFETSSIEAPGMTEAAATTVVASVTVLASTGCAECREGAVRSASAQQIEQTAGAFADPSRYLQTFAGVAAGSDQRNDVLVRGGNPSENLFILDNIEIPSINQLALSDTTGGFTSMLNPEAIERLTLHTDAYASRFEQRLSSVIEISTRPTETVIRHSVLELGIAGAGGTTVTPFGHEGSLLFSGRQSVLQYGTNDIGLNGVPKFRNVLLRAEDHPTARDSWWGVSLTGIDSLAVHPSATDTAETNPYDIAYTGWRSTSGINWQHVFAPSAFGVLSAANSMQTQSIGENDQVAGNASIYNEQTRDNITTLKYDFSLEPTRALRVDAGGRAAVDAFAYGVSQPFGLEDPYSRSSTPVNAGAWTRQDSTGSGAVYAEASIALPHGLDLSAGDRLMRWNLAGRTANSLKGSLSAPVHGHIFSVGYAEYAQMPATLYLLAFTNRQTLAPIRTRQLTVGLNLVDDRRMKLGLALYQKRYRDYPVAAAYPELALANVADTFGTAFLLFPMTAAGIGLARGGELSLELRPASNFSLGVNAAYARAWYAGSDGVLRRGNYDQPVSATMFGAWTLKHGMLLSFKEALASGRPYTPDDLALSTAQDRDVYDLSQINAVRGPFYARTDLRFEQTVVLRRGRMTWYVGLENVFNRENFYAVEWEPRSDQPSVQNQMPRIPDGGVRYTFE
jgi:hypothetical protein